MSDLAQPSQGEFLFASTGKKVVEEPIRLDHGSYKGKLHYEAEFVPAIPVKGIGFESGPNVIEQATKRRASGTDTDSGTVADDRSSTSSLRRERAASKVIQGPTVTQPLDEDEKLEGQNGTLPLTEEPAPIGGGTPEEHRPEEEGVELSQSELLKHRKFIFGTVTSSGTAESNKLTQSLVSLSLTSSLGSCTRRRAWRCCWTKLIGLHSVLCARAATRRTGSISARALSRNLISGVCGCG